MRLYDIGEINPNDTTEMNPNHMDTMSPNAVPEASPTVIDDMIPDNIEKWSQNKKALLKMLVKNIAISTEDGE